MKFFSGLATGVLAASLLALITLVPASAQELDLTDAEKAFIAEHPVIRAHNEMAWPPYNFNVDGEPQGFSIDYLNLVAEKTGLAVEYISGPSWDEFKQMLRSGDLDVMLNTTNTAERREYAHFTRPYALTPAAVIVRDPNLIITSFEDLHGLRVAATRGFSTEEFFALNHPEVDLVLEDNLLDTLYAVIEGRADATMDDYPALNYLMQLNSLPGLRVAFLSSDPDVAESPAVGVRIDQPILRDILQKGMDALDEDEVASLRRKWLGIGTTTTEKKLELTAAERAWVSEHPIIRVHADTNWPPFNFFENGQPTGFSIEYINLLASVSGLQIEYINGPIWTEIMRMIQSGELEVVLDTTATPDRNKVLNFTEPNVDSPLAVVVRDQTIQVRSLQDLQGKRVAVAEGYLAQEVLGREYPDIELVLETDTLGALYAVVEGRADAVLDDVSVVLHLIDQQSLTGLQVAFIGRTPELIAHRAIGIRKDWPILRDILQKSMDSLDESKVSELRKKWLNIDQEFVTPEQTPNTTLWLLGGALGIFVLLMLLNMISRRFAGEEREILQTGTPRFRILIFGFLSIFVLLVIIGGSMALDRIKGKILRDAASNLENVLVTTTDRLDIWVELQQSILRQIAMNTVLIQHIEELLNVATNPAALQVRMHWLMFATRWRKTRLSLALAFSSSIGTASASAPPETPISVHVI